MDVRLLKRFRREAKKKVIVSMGIIKRDELFIRIDELSSANLTFDGEDWLYRSARGCKVYNINTIKDGYRKAINGYIRYLAYIERYKREQIRIMELNKKLRYNIK